MTQQKPSMLVPALIGGGFLGVTSSLPIINLFNCACCLLVIAGGVLATILYNREYPAHLGPLSYGDGAVLGAFTGLLGGVIWTIAGALIDLIRLSIGLRFISMDQLEPLLRQSNIPPALQELLSNVVVTGALGTGIILASLVFNTIIAVIFATLGGIIGVALVQRQAAPPTSSAPVVSPAEPYTPAAPRPPAEEPAPAPDDAAAPAEEEKPEPRSDEGDPKGE